MLKKLLHIMGWLALIIFIVGTLAFTGIDSKKVVCKNIEVSFNENDPIKLSENDVLRLVKSANKQIIDKTLDQINSEMIETEVVKHQAIQKADVYKIISQDSGKYKGTLVVKVKHRKPVLRVMGEYGNYYLDKSGNKIPVSPNYTTKVLVVTGFLSESLARELLPFVHFVQEDDFWKAQIEQIHVEKNGDVIIIPLIGDHTIVLGSVDDFEMKLRKMRAFYDQVLVKKGWSKYKSISLKYDNQVIAKRN